MTNQEYLQDLAAQIQKAVGNYNSNDTTSWIPIQNAMECLRREIEPPHIFVMKQRFHLISKTLENVCILAALEMGLLQILSDNKGKSVTATELAKVSGYNELFISKQDLF
ncbi:hypothetical protein N7462_004044 [Penicillium macrosclerotiorum]|uniref:uncharacterized protein n=1 Tax=Penicillium macrosclerotiorum TaxID=303699 RepID=UPI002547228A|nr:uncharacterized protein N7462_004044 [Penicillium macrosclerotiorum]KAJ5689652.1 hypothetical protein N7462_004044 [Penicillium macrosclerotiorum]